MIETMFVKHSARGLIHLLCLAVGASLLANQDKPISVANRLEVPVPMGPIELEAVLGRLSTLTQKPLGAEIVIPFESMRERPADRDWLLDLTGLSMDQALARLAQLEYEGPVRNYYASSANGVWHFGPVSFRNNRQIALNAQIRPANLRAASTQEAIYAFERLYDSSYPQPPALRVMPDRVRQLTQRGFSVDRPVAIGRDILDDLILQQGAASWFAEYLNASGQGGFGLRFIGFDRWSLAAPPASLVHKSK